ncbi:MAG: helix-turn-helix transcriptional regulator [Deltaproteobacteria bacterium]|nr:helix-turn-helix transcriptional regulator [Deltaproteobacteria bacterium]
MNTLGAKIRAVRKTLKLNQKQFALEIGLESAVAISQYEKNKREPDINRLKKISELGNISLNELMNSEGVEASRLNNASVKQPEQSTPVIQGTYQSEFRVSDALTMCARVLESGTSYATALYLNIQHFDRAVSAEARNAIIEKKLADLEARNQIFEDQMQTRLQEMENKLELLHTENRVLQTENNRLKATYEDPDGADGRITNTENQAM